MEQTLTTLHTYKLEIIGNWEQIYGNVYLNATNKQL